MTIYKYGMRLRGFAPGCQPMRGFCYWREDTSGKYHSIICYNRPLTETELANYELDFIGTEKGVNL